MLDPFGSRNDLLSNHISSVKRALRALQSPAYNKASSKNPLLPPVTSPATASEVFKLLPLSLLALRVSKTDPHAGHDHAPPTKQKRVKGLWHVRIEQQQDISDDLHYIWLYEGPQWKQKLYAGGALILILAAVMFPLWPMTLRIGVWYLSMGLLGLIGLFFAMAIFRLILFCATVFTVPPGLWLYPNLFEDVGFFDSFRPIWGWQEVSVLHHNTSDTILISFAGKEKEGLQKGSKSLQRCLGHTCKCNGSKAGVDSDSQWEYGATARPYSACGRGRGRLVLRWIAFEHCNIKEGFAITIIIANPNLNESMDCV